MLLTFYLNLAQKFLPLNKLYFYLLTALLLLNFSFSTAQAPKKIIIEHSDFVDVQQSEIPGAIVLTGNVVIIHEGIRMTCNKAYQFRESNEVKAFGNVVMIQGDTLTMNSKYAEYNGDTKFAMATGNVVMRDPKMTLTTDTINFDRNLQEAFYTTYGTVRDQENVLRSKSGRYFMKQKKLQFLTAVTVTNPKYIIKSNHLDYFTNSGHAYLFGPSTITGKDDFIYTEKGFYDTKKNLATLLTNSYIKYNDRLIKGDSMFYDKAKDFASATRNVKITDSINRGVIRGHYAEVYKQKDSMFVTKRAVAVNFVENDSVYIHAKVLMITGKPQDRIIRAFKNARIYKTDMSGKCDSIHSSERIGLTKMIGKPVLWNGESQMTGDIMHLISNNVTEKLDSLKVLNNAFIVQKDTLGTGYNQVKGVNLYGKFLDNKLHEVDIIKNTEVIYYNYSEKQELTGIEKAVCSRINMILEDNKITMMTMFDNPDGIFYPEADLPENARKLRGFIWRGDERIRTKDDIFPPEENEYHDKMLKETEADSIKEEVPMEIRKETLDYDKKKKGK